MYSTAKEEMTFEDEHAFLNVFAVHVGRAGNDQQKDKRLASILRQQL